MYFDLTGIGQSHQWLLHSAETHVSQNKQAAAEEANENEGKGNRV
jgi:hypothetical protein